MMGEKRSQKYGVGQALANARFFPAKKCDFGHFYVAFADLFDRLILYAHGRQ